jgi:acetoin utilization deacetylase AcuC-like enzyme
VLEALQERKTHEIVEVRDFGMDPIGAVHDAGYLEFLRGIWDRWKSAGNEGDVIPYLWPVPGLKRMSHPNLNALVGGYAFSSDTPIMAGTWSGAYRGAQCALTAVDLVDSGERAAFALTRPPGHHAHAAIYGGYCFLNNAAIAAESARSRGYERVGILDVDFHHGNGTQDIFYARGDVLTISLHGDPETSFPYFLGYADETGVDEGVGANLNLPMPADTGFDSWSRSLQTAIDRLKEFGASFLVVPLGVDTFESDPISSFRLTARDYHELGHRLAGIDLPTVFVLEGGYDAAHIGENVSNVLDGFDASNSAR